MSHPAPKPLDDDERDRLKMLGSMKVADMTGKELIELLELNARSKIADHLSTE